MNKITGYFTKVKTIEYVEVEVVQKLDQFYADCINDRIDDTKCSVECDQIKLNLREKLAEQKEQCSKIEQALLKCQSIIEEKNKKITQLQKNAEKLSKVNIEVNNSPTSRNVIDVTSPKAKSTQQILFKDYEHLFSSEVLASLRSYGREINFDSTFVLTIMREFYGNDLDALKTTGMNNKRKNERMEDDRIKSLRTLFDERLTGLNLIGSPKNVRMKRLNVLIRSARNNIFTKAKKMDLFLEKQPESVAVNTEPNE